MCAVYFTELIILDYTAEKPYCISLVLVFSLLQIAHTNLWLWSMDTTPGVFRWAPAPDLAAWSSDRDREAAPSDGTSTTNSIGPGLVAT